MLQHPPTDGLRRGQAVNLACGLHRDSNNMYSRSVLELDAKRESNGPQTGAGGYGAL